MTEETTKSPGRRYLADSLLGILPLLLGVQLLAWITFFPSALRGHSDFRQLYAAGYMVRTGHAGELYDYRMQKEFQNSLVGNDERALPFIRPAYQALIFVPFSIVSYRSAYLAFLIVNLILLVVAFWLLHGQMQALAGVWRALPFFLFLVFYPVALALMQGQDSIILLVLLAAALVSLRKERDLAAGILLGLGLFKMQIVAPIALLFLLWRRWRLVAGFAFSAALLSLLSFWIVGFTQTAVYIHSLFSVGSGLGDNQVRFPLRVSLMANLRGLTFGALGGWVPAFWMQTLTVILSIILLLWVAASASRKMSAADAFVVAITTSVIVSYYLFIHDLSVLLIPIVLTLNRYFEKSADGNPSRASLAWSSAGLLVAPFCLFLIPEHFYVVALPLCAFLFVVIRNLPRGPDQGSDLDRARS